MGKSESFCFCFHGGKIFFAEQQEGEYSPFEVPSLFLAGGMLANRVGMEEFRAAKPCGPLSTEGNHQLAQRARS